MLKILLRCLFVMVILYLPAQAQDAVHKQGPDLDQEKGIVQPPATPTALTTYTKWRDELLPKYAQRELTLHYAIAVVARRLDDQTAQVEMLLAADMKHYTITIRPVTLNRAASGEVTATPIGKAVTLDQKAGRKATSGPDAIRLGEWTTTVAVGKTAEAIEITWEPKKDQRDDPSNTCIVRLSKEPSV